MGFQTCFETEPTGSADHVAEVGVRWEVPGDCGHETDATEPHGTSLRAGHTSHCGSWTRSWDLSPGTWQEGHTHVPLGSSCMSQLMVKPAGPGSLVMRQTDGNTSRALILSCCDACGLLAPRASQQLGTQQPWILADAGSKVSSLSQGRTGSPVTEKAEMGVGGVGWGWGVGEIWSSVDVRGELASGLGFGERSRPRVPCM